jgi:hypothetical protein
LPFYPTNTDEAIVVLYDLRDPDAWERAGRERRAWGCEFTEVHTLTNDVIAVEFKPGGALEVPA